MRTWGLMRKMMVRWFERYEDMLKEIDAIPKCLRKPVSK
jgi:hypothetical protein